VKLRDAIEVKHFALLFYFALGSLIATWLSLYLQVDSGFLLVLGLFTIVIAACGLYLVGASLLYVAVFCWGAFAGPLALSLAFPGVSGLRGDDLLSTLWLVSTFGFGIFSTLVTRLGRLQRAQIRRGLR